jgi:hypothetical protein
MTDTKKELKKIKVKEIYFDENGIMPCFELENGEIKKGYFMGTQNGPQLHFYTNNEWANIIHQIEIAKKEAMSKKNLILPGNLRKV